MLERAKQGAEKQESRGARPLPLGRLRATLPQAPDVAARRRAGRRRWRARQRALGIPHPQPHAGALTAAQ